MPPVIAVLGGLVAALLFGVLRGALIRLRRRRRHSVPALLPWYLGGPADVSAPRPDHDDGD